MKLELTQVTTADQQREQAASGVGTKPTVLIIEDEAGPREALKILLRPFFNLYAVDKAESGMQILHERQVDLVTLDLKLPGRHGTDVLQDIKREHDDVEVIIITGYGSVKSAMEGVRYGASAYLLKPFDATELIAVINQVLEKRRTLRSVRAALDAFAACEGDPTLAWKSLSPLLEAKDPELARHATCVNYYAARFAEHLGLTEDERTSLQIGSYLHDIGKIEIDAQLLMQPAVLAGPECRLDRLHPELGAQIARKLSLPPMVGQIIRHHHEQYDGAGYPDGLRGENIPYLARIMCIVNVFDELTANHSDPDEVATQKAGEYIRVEAGSRFDPMLAEHFATIASRCRLSAIT